VERGPPSALAKFFGNIANQQLGNILIINGLEYLANQLLGYMCDISYVKNFIIFYLSVQSLRLLYHPCNRPIRANYPKVVITACLVVCGGPRLVTVKVNPLCVALNTKRTSILPPCQNHIKLKVPAHEVSLLYSALWRKRRNKFSGGGLQIKG
jgi:hypothetical protein